jgi:hypothetical protein
MITVTKRNIIYGLVDPRSGELRYVGKSTSGLTRPKKHLTSSLLRKEANTHRVKWIKSVIKDGLLPRIVVLEETEDPELLDGLEKAAIAKFRAEGVRLVNGTDGGEGSLGRRQTEGARRKISEAKRGKPGHKHTEEHKEYMRMLYLGKTRPLSVREKLRAACKGRVQSRETIEKQRVSRKKLYGSSEWQIQNSRKKGGRPVVEVSTGQRYESISIAARSLGLNPGNIANVLSGRQKRTGMFSFVFAEVSA